MNCRATVFLACFAAQPALAVPEGRVSITAETVCAYRAVAAQHPDARLRNPDDLAGQLCPPGRTSLPRSYPEARYVIDSDASHASYYYVNARTHYIDAALARAAAAGVAQVVVLGAGFDSRAYRFRRSHPQVRFFEVDLPATIEEKKRRLASAFGAVPDYVRYAPIDFDRQKLEDVLAPLGYDARQPAFFILEGVLMYVREEGTSATLRFIASQAPGSRVVYDYVLQPIIEGKYGNYHAAGIIAFMVERRGEPYVMGWTPRSAATFAKQHGLQVVEDIDATGLTRRHLTGSDGKPDGRMTDWLRIIEARVP